MEWHLDIISQGLAKNILYIAKQCKVCSNFLSMKYSDEAEDWVSSNIKHISWSCLSFKSLDKKMYIIFR